jgi:hypothetical protein
MVHISDWLKFDWCSLYTHIRCRTAWTNEWANQLWHLTVSSRYQTTSTAHAKSLVKMWQVRNVFLFSNQKNSTYYIYYITIRVKVMVRLSLCLTKSHAMKTYGGGGGITPYPWLLYPWTGGWVGPRTGLGTVVKRKNLSCHELNPSHLAQSLVTILTELFHCLPFV